MINWHSIFLFLSVLQLTSVSKVLQIHFNGLNGKHYIIKESENPFRMVLTVMEPNEVTEKFELPSCSIKNTVTYRAVKIQENTIYMHILGGEHEFLQVVDLAALSDHVTKSNCIPIAETYFGKHKVYIYKIEGKNILKRWLVTPDGREINPVKVAETKLPIVYAHIYGDKIKIYTSNKNVYDPNAYEYHMDSPRDDTPENNTRIEINQISKKEPQIIYNTEQTTTMHVVTTTYTEPFSSDIPEEDPVLEGNLETVPTTEQTTTMSVETTMNMEFFRNNTPDEENPVSGEKSEIIFTTEQTITKPSENVLITISERDLKVVGITVIVLLFILILRRVGYYLLNRKRKSEKILQITSAELYHEHRISKFNGKNSTIREYLHPFRLVLATKKSNGTVKEFPLPTCNQTKAKIFSAYFGKHKIYIYKVEGENTLKRWLLTSDMKLTNPAVIAKTKLPITHVNVFRSEIKITMKDKNTNNSYIEEYYQDLPRCDVPENTTSCKEDQVSGGKSEITSTTKKTITKPSENILIAISERDLKVVGITFIVSLFILTLLRIGYYLLNRRWKSRRKIQDRINRESYMYAYVPERNYVGNYYDVPMNARVPSDPLPPPQQG
ncbi:hypothetical protein FO519_005528 [Halicephalobus sp. NKZ332]|nr:hypothetical protein FO519_005528 [Halicephalobus sp. NKZ332]